MEIAHDTSTLTTATKYALVEAIVMIVNIGLRKDDYIAIDGAKARGASIYSVITETKKTAILLTIE